MSNILAFFRARFAKFLQLIRPEPAVAAQPSVLSGAAASASDTPTEEAAQKKSASVTPAASLPAPLTPHDANLTKYHFLPLEGVAFIRLHDWMRCKDDHKLAFATINLMLHSWHSKPAGSLKNDEMALRNAAGCDSTQWAEVKDQVMEGWTLCSDGLFYHPYVAEKALDALKGQLKRAYETECDRVAKWNERHDGVQERMPTFKEWVAAGALTGRRPQHARDVRETNRRQHGDSVHNGKGVGQQYLKGEGIRADGVVPFEMRATWIKGLSILDPSGAKQEDAELALTKLLALYPDVLAAAICRTAEKPRKIPKAYLTMTCKKMAQERTAISSQMSFAPDAERQARDMHAAPPRQVGMHNPGMQSIGDLTNGLALRTKPNPL